MTPPKDDLYAFLGIPRTSVPAAVDEAIARAEKRLSGKHGLGLTELSRRRALLLQAKRWLAVEDRRFEYDRSLTSPRASDGPTPAGAGSAQATRTLPKPGPQAPSAPTRRPAAAPSSPPLPPSAREPGELEEGDEDGEEAEDSATWLSLPVVAAALAAATLLAFGLTFGVLWVLSGEESPAVAAKPSVPAEPASLSAAEEPAQPAPSEMMPAGVVGPSSSDEVVLTPATAVLLGQNVRVDAAADPPRIENWTSADSVEWKFDSPAAAIYQATLVYAMKPECEGNRYRVSVGSASAERVVGSGAYVDGTYRDVFFLKVPNRGLATLRIEPLDVVGGELMEFRSLTLAVRQKSFGS